MLGAFLLNISVGKNRFHLIPYLGFLFSHFCCRFSDLDRVRDFVKTTGESLPGQGQPPDSARNWPRTWRLSDWRVCRPGLCRRGVSPNVSFVVGRWKNRGAAVSASSRNSSVVRGLCSPINWTVSSVKSKRKVAKKQNWYVTLEKATGILRSWLKLGLKRACSIVQSRQVPIFRYMYTN